MKSVDIRATIIKAIASDDELADLLVLKGGNALEIIHRIGKRASFDVDYSTATDFENPDEIANRLFRALRDRFDSDGLYLFDEKFGPRPRGRKPGTIGADTTRNSK